MEGYDVKLRLRFLKKLGDLSELLVVFGGSGEGKLQYFVHNEGVGYSVESVFAKIILAGYSLINWVCVDVRRHR